MDSSTGQILKGNLVEGIGCEEMIYFKKKDVYTQVLVREAYEETGQARMDLRWMDVNNGDDDTPNFRSRSVATHPS